MITVPRSFRITPEANEMLDILDSFGGVKRSAAVEDGIRRVYKGRFGSLSPQDVRKLRKAAPKKSS